MEERDVAAAIDAARQTARSLIERATWQLIPQSFPVFLFHLVKTRDEHDPRIYAKPIPALDYIRTLATALQLYRRLAIPKSRQMLVSWVVCAFVLWVALTRDHALCFIQSKREEDADALLKRIHDIYVRLPAWLQAANPINPARDGGYQLCHMKFHWTDEQIRDRMKREQNEALWQLVGTERAHIWAIPQGEDVLRQHTATLIFSDEDAFQDEAAAAYQAAAPTLSADAWWIKVSSANPGHFEAVVKDKALER